MLPVVIVVALALAVAAFVYAFIALYHDSEVQKDIKGTAEKLNETAATAAAASGEGGSGLAAGTTPQAAFSGASDYLEALAKFADSISKLKQGVAALVVGLALVIFAGVAAGVDDKVDDSDSPPIGAEMNEAQETPGG